MTKNKTIINLIYKQIFLILNIYISIISSVLIGFLLSIYFPNYPGTYLLPSIDFSFLYDSTPFEFVFRTSICFFIPTYIFFMMFTFIPYLKKFRYSLIFIFFFILIFNISPFYLEEIIGSFVGELGQKITGIGEAFDSFGLFALPFVMLLRFVATLFILAWIFNKFNNK